VGVVHVKTLNAFFRKEFMNLTFRGKNIAMAPEVFLTYIQ
jgi:hypothetical protein